MANSGQQNRGSDSPEFRGEEDKFQSPGPRVSSPTEDYSRESKDLPPGEDPPSRAPGEGTIAADDDSDENRQGQLDHDAWLIQKAHEIYTSSTDYLDANITNEWERNLAHFHNEHSPGTVYRRKGFRRSRVFRPKTRANVKQQEAGLAAAAFSTLSLASLTAQDERNKKQVLSAAINQEILNYRLENTVPWFQTVMGAYQDTKVYGLCISHQCWRYREDTDVIPAFDSSGTLIYEEDEESGKKVAMGEEMTVVRQDKVCCDNVAPENFRFDPMCDWRDPVSTSPYLIYMMPIYAGEALEMMESIDNKTGMPMWKKHSLGTILGTRRQDYDRTRQAREGRERIDPADEQHGNEYTTLWAHMNIIKVNGEDMVFWTMGTEILLTDTMKLSEQYPWLRMGERPFQVGFSTVESHRNYPAGDVEQTAGLQQEINSVANQRLDNVKLVLNKRYFVRRGSQVDLDALIRNTPGGGVMMNDPEKDVEVVNTPDVTGSSYQEHDRLAQEYDDLAGAFNPTSGGGGKSKEGAGSGLGGAKMQGAKANAVQDYGIKIFIETWMEPVLKQLVRLEQMYETDDVLLALAGERAQAFEKFGIDELTDDLLTQHLTVRVNVGMGNTDPLLRVERLVMGVTKTAELPGMVPRMKSPAIADEIFGALGYKDSTRFFMGDEEFQQFMQQKGEEKPPLEHQEKMRELDIREADNNMRDVREVRKLEQDLERAGSESAAKERIVDKQSESQGAAAAQAERMHSLDLANAAEKDKMADKTNRDKAALEGKNKVREINAKQAGTK